MTRPVSDDQRQASVKAEHFVSAYLRCEGYAPEEFDVDPLTVSLVSICPKGNIKNLGQVDGAWVAHTIRKFAKRPTKAY